jgi:hypothetical protein
MEGGDRCIQFKDVIGPQCAHLVSALSYWEAHPEYFGKRADGVQACPQTSRRMMILQLLDRVAAYNIGDGGCQLLDSMAKLCKQPSSAIHKYLCVLKDGRLVVLTHGPEHTKLFYIVYIYMIKAVQLLGDPRLPSENTWKMPQDLRELCEIATACDERVLDELSNDLRVRSMELGETLQMLNLAEVSLLFALYKPKRDKGLKRSNDGSRQESNKKASQQQNHQGREEGRDTRRTQEAEEPSEAGDTSGSRGQSLSEVRRPLELAEPGEPENTHSIKVVMFIITLVQLMVEITLHVTKARAAVQDQALQRANRGAQRAAHLARRAGQHETGMG